MLLIREDAVLLDGRPLHLTDRETAVLRALAGGRVVSRSEIRRAAQLDQHSDRRCDSILVGLRRVLPEGAIRNVRGRGWMLEHPIE